ncbi:glycosyltransferase family 4 protein [Desulfovibrio inopinatus]|uniref:glycosyltransferase family 4 protein n=1 Tax=Desulfovibrio inopinatus TaxID=102109 RepID=UPI000406D81D|nr:glycosyltransferase family 4 protein [Desulfovibrio inopinatus]
MTSRPNVLLVMEECNPDWPSVPLVAFRFYDEIRKYCQTVLVTHVRNREGLERVRGQDTITYIEESRFSSGLYNVVAKAFGTGQVNWPLLHAMSYPLYMEFDFRVRKQFSSRVRAGEFDLVHAMTPVMPRYPYSIAKDCVRVPFVLGPVNGGVPFPPGFAEVGRTEGSRFNFLRQFARFLPGYRQTYARANQILAGSIFTKEFLQTRIGIPADKLLYFPENGVPQSFFRQEVKPYSDNQIKLLFVGRLTAYKGADMTIEALAGLPDSVRKHVSLTIVGDGPQRQELELLTQTHGLKEHVQFTGFIPQDATRQAYFDADIFVFPSVREFGGAVVLEAIAAGLPCIVADNGGIAEYITDECGIALPPTSRTELTASLTSTLNELVNDPGRLQAMSRAAIERAQQFSWEAKGKALIEIYRTCISAASGRTP